jgi:hypothetical protein
LIDAFDGSNALALTGRNKKRNLRLLVGFDDRFDRLAWIESTQAIPVLIYDRVAELQEARNEDSAADDNGSFDARLLHLCWPLFLHLCLLLRWI